MFLMDDKIRIVIADDHAGLRQDVTQLIEATLITPNCSCPFSLNRVIPLFISEYSPNYEKQ